VSDKVTGTLSPRHPVTTRYLITMAAFRRVEARQAGPGALGILVPPGERTLVIVRPRALTWDLLPARWQGDPRQAPRLCTFNREEAALTARHLLQDLEDAVARGVNPVETLGDLQGKLFQVWLRTETLVWILCARAAGQAYRPLLFVTQDEARSAAERLAPVVWPAADAEQECYFNTQQFA
jgi:hypothetical protein